MKNAFFYFLKVFTFFGVLFFGSQSISAQKPSIKNQESLAVNVQHKIDSAKIDGLIVEGKKYSQNLDKRAPNYFLSALKLSALQKKSNPKQQVDALSALGFYYALKGSHDSAKYYYGKLMQNGIEHNNQLTVARANIGFGIVADYQADYETAIGKNLLALKYAESVLDSNGIAAASGNIGNSYIRLKQFKKAIPLLNTAIEIYTKKGQKVSAANNISSLARVYRGLGDRKTELELKLKAFSMFKAASYKKGMATVAINLGVYYNGEKNTEEAKKYYFTALKNMREINEKGNIAILYNNMSDMYLDLRQLDSAKVCSDSAYYYASKSGDKLSQYDALLSQSNVLHAMGKHEEADKFLTRYIALKDSVLNDKMQQQVANMEVQYGTEKKESKIVLLNKENSIKALMLLNNRLELDKNRFLIDRQQQQLTISELELTNKSQIVANQKLDADKKAQNIKALEKQTKIQDLELKNRKLELEQRNLAMGSILVVFLALGGVSFSYYKRNKLKQQNLLQTEIYKQKEIATKSVFEGEQNERIRIARDLHDGIGQMLSVVKMNVSTLNPADKTVEGTLSLVDKTITELRAISHNLIPEALNFGLFAALEDICQKISEAGKTQVALSVAEEINDIQLTQQNKLSIYRIVQEVLNNMIKHANASHISIEIRKAHENMLIVIKDDGDGFDTSKIDDSKGIGWKNISARVHLMDGDMNIKSEKLVGTQIEISIPA
ncbi:Signal transduction histidine-protein kinase/phosphatase DegS [compost metagenome]